MSSTSKFINKSKTKNAFKLNGKHKTLETDDIFEVVDETLEF